MGYARVKSDRELLREMFAGAEVSQLRAGGLAVRRRRVAESDNPIDWFIQKATEVEMRAVALAKTRFATDRSDYPFESGNDERRYIDSFKVTIEGGVRPGIRVANNAPHAVLVEIGRPAMKAREGGFLTLPVKPGHVDRFSKKVLVKRNGRTYLYTKRVKASDGLGIVRDALRQTFR